MKDIITLKINCTNFIDVKSDDLTVVQIQFDGSASGEYFNGKVMPGGVDTQKIFPDGTGKLSARYTLEGKDCEGNECKIFIENEADLGGSVTRPSVLTDSAALSWMNNSEFVGELINDDSGLRIIIRLAEK